MSYNDQAARDAVLDLVHVQSSDVDPLGRIFVPSRAATPEPASPRSRPLRASTERSSPPLFEPYPTPSTSPARKRVRPTGNKRSMNAFLIYRREFPTRYPHIDKLERHQGPKSSIIGAMWRAEPLDVKEYFFRLQAAADDEFRREHGTADAPRADPVKTLMRRERARQRRTRDEKLAPRSELIVKLWSEKTSVAEFIRAVHEYDEQCKATAPKPEPKLKIVMSGNNGSNARPLSNHTNTIMDDEVTSPLTPVASSPEHMLQATSFIAEVPAFPGSPADMLSSGVSEPAITPVQDAFLPMHDPLDMIGQKEIDMYFGDLLELVQPAEAYPFMPVSADSGVNSAFMSQILPQFPDPAPLWQPDTLNPFGNDLQMPLLPPFGQEMDAALYTTGWDAYAGGGFDLENANGVYALGLGCDLAALETAGAPMFESVGSLGDCFVDMGLPPLP